MDLNRLEEFTIIAKYSSIKKAAEELGIPTATLSFRINSFEKTIGTPLFQRHPNQLTLTPSGRKLLYDAPSIIHTFQNIKDELKGTSLSRIHNLKIMIVGPHLPFALESFLNNVCSNHIDLSLDFVDDSYCSVEDGLNKNLIDMVFAPTMKDSFPNTIVRHTLTHPLQYVLLPTTHRLSDYTFLTMKDLENETFIIYPKKPCSILRDYIIENLSTSGINYHIYKGESSSFFIEQLVIYQKGLILTPFLSLENNSKIKRTPILSLPHPAASSVLYSRDHVRPDAKLFIDAFLKYVKELPPYDN